MERVLNSLNPFGKFQKLSVLLVGLSSALVAMLTYSTVFILAEPKLLCTMNKQNSTEGLFFSNTLFLNDTSENCKIWNHLVNHINQTQTNDYRRISSDEISCEFDKTYYGLTIVSEWGLVCQKKYLATSTQTFFLIGTFTGIFLGLIFFNSQIN